MPKKIILAADDDEDVLELLSVVAESGNYEFIGVKSGTECLDTLNKTKPCLILLDVEMPEMNGFEALEEIRERFPRMSTPVAFLTAHKSFEMIEQASKLGSKTFILKPVDPHRLLERIKELTDGAKPTT